MQALTVSTVFGIGILCALIASRGRKYRQAGTKDPFKPWLMGGLTAVACIAIGLLIFGHW